MTRFEDYELREELARGSMGVVYRAWDPVRGCEVAIKRMSCPGSPDDVRRFRVEVAAAARLDHPHVVGVHAAGEDASGVWLAMDLVEGESLFDVLRREGPLAWQRVVRLGRRLSDALQHAHDAGVLHRDIKPHNVVLDAHGEPRLADFGLARLVDADSQLTRDGDLLGTPVYMPPEQALGKRDEVGVASDVYSLGASLYHLLTGQPPFWDTDLTRLVRKVVRDAPPPPSTLAPDVPRALDAVILRCLEKDSAARYPSAAALSEALAAFERPAPSPRPAPAWVKAVVAGLLGLTMAVLGLARWRQAEGSARAHAPPPSLGSSATPSATSSPQAGAPRPPAETPVYSSPASASATPSPEDPGPPPTRAALPRPSSSPPDPNAILAALNRLETRRAAELAEALVAERPGAAVAQWLLGEVRAEQGDYAAALAAWERSHALDPRLVEQIPRRRAAIVAQFRDQPVSGDLPARFDQALGGSWRVDPDGTVRAVGNGLGTYEVSLLLDDEAPREPPYRLEVEVLRNPDGLERLDAYVGVVLGARARDDFFTLFLVDDPEDVGQFAPQGDAAAYRAEHGVDPVLLRMTWQNGPRWDFPANALAPPQPASWTRLVVDVEGDRVRGWLGQDPEVDPPVVDVRLPRRVEGRVGLLRFYHHAFAFRRWQVTPR